jgi:hypothetical protein
MDRSTSHRRRTRKRKVCSVVTKEQVSLSDRRCPEARQGSVVDCGTLSILLDFSIDDQTAAVGQPTCGKKLTIQHDFKSHGRRGACTLAGPDRLTELEIRFAAAFSHQQRHGRHPLCLTVPRGFPDYVLFPPILEGCHVLPATQ